MRARMSGGVGGGGATPPPTRSGFRLSCGYSYGGFEGGHPHFHPHATPVGNPRIKRRAHLCRESSESVRSFGLAWVFALAALHRDPAPSGGIAARVAASVPMVTSPDRIGSSGRGSPDQFKLDQRVRSVCPGRRRTVLKLQPGTIRLGICTIQAFVWPNLVDRLSARDHERPLVAGG